jgi:BirA family biotin operon repressor/biotin-[acetyl-CoA-carboxylase] ligase
MEIELIHIVETKSTNNYAKKLYFEKKYNSDFCVVAHHQSAGKGQLGATWETQAGKNLTFSFVLQNLNLAVKDQFKLSALVSLNFVEALQKLNLHKVKLKWPNDIIIDHYKVAGILIETIIREQVIKSVIVGIGLNVNQLEFNSIPKASSLKKITGINYHLDEVLQYILKEMEKLPMQLKSLNISNILNAYHGLLFRKNRVSMFRLQNGNIAPGIIQGVQENGLLQVLFEDERLELFDVKEIKLIY